MIDDKWVAVVTIVGIVIIAAIIIVGGFYLTPQSEQIGAYVGIDSQHGYYVCYLVDKQEFRVSSNASEIIQYAIDHIAENQNIQIAENLHEE